MICPGTAAYFADHVFQTARPLIDSGKISLPDPMLDPRYQLERMLQAMRLQKLT